MRTTGDLIPRWGTTACSISRFGYYVAPSPTTPPKRPSFVRAARQTTVQKSKRGSRAKEQNTTITVGGPSLLKPDDMLTGTAADGEQDAGEATTLLAVQQPNEPRSSTPDPTIFVPNDTSSDEESSDVDDKNANSSGADDGNSPENVPDELPRFDENFSDNSPETFANTSNHSSEPNVIPESSPPPNNDGTPRTPSENNRDASNYSIVSLEILDGMSNHSSEPDILPELPPLPDNDGAPRTPSENNSDDVQVSEVLSQLERNMGNLVSNQESPKGSEDDFHLKFNAGESHVSSPSSPESAIDTNSNGASDDLGLTPPTIMIDEDLGLSPEGLYLAQRRQILRQTEQDKTGIDEMPLTPFDAPKIRLLDDKIESWLLDNKTEVFLDKDLHFSEAGELKAPNTKDSETLIILKLVDSKGKTEIEPKPIKPLFSPSPTLWPVASIYFCYSRDKIPLCFIQMWKLNDKNDVQKDQGLLHAYGAIASNPQQWLSRINKWIHIYSTDKNYSPATIPWNRNEYRKLNNYQQRSAALAIVFWRTFRFKEKGGLKDSEIKDIMEHPFLLDSSLEAIDTVESE